MDWTESLRAAIAYMEEHLLEDISAEDVAESVHLSPYYLQKGFSIMTGYTIGEYIRGRRLYKAALDVVTGREKIIDIAYTYGYETPESFSKAFSRFHGVSPLQLKGDTSKIKTFLPLKISIVIQGGNEMDYMVEKWKVSKSWDWKEMFLWTIPMPRFRNFGTRSRSSSVRPNSAAQTANGANF